MLEPVNISVQRNWSLKTNLRILIIYATESFKASISGALTQCPNLNIDWLDIENLSTNHFKGTNPPDLMYVETHDDWASKIANVYSAGGEELHNLQVALYVFGDEDDTASLKLSLRLGASDYYSKSVDIDALYPHLKSTAEDKISSNEMAEMILFLNTKGGSGSTTLAVNVGVELAANTDSSVLLVDLDMQFSGAGDYLNCKPKYFINDLVDALGDIDAMSLDGLIHKHSSNLHYLGFNPDNYRINHRCADGLSKVLPILRLYYDHIVVDMSNGIQHEFSQLIAPANHVCLVVQQNVTSIKHAASYVRYLELDFGLSREQIEVVVNRYEKRLPISVRDIERSIPVPHLHMVPNRFDVAIESANLGEPIVLSSKRNPLKSALQKISHDLDTTSTKQKEGSWLKRLFS